MTYLGCTPGKLLSMETLNFVEAGLIWPSDSSQQRMVDRPFSENIISIPA